MVLDSLIVFARTLAIADGNEAASNSNSNSNGSSCRRATAKAKATLQTTTSGSMFTIRAKGLQKVKSLARGEWFMPGNRGRVSELEVKAAFKELPNDHRD
jgi:hypothetical protein